MQSLFGFAMLPLKSVNKQGMNLYSSRSVGEFVTMGYEE